MDIALVLDPGERQFLDPFLPAIAQIIVELELEEAADLSSP
jgi:hypothetical protein